MTSVDLQELVKRMQAEGPRPVDDPQRAHAAAGDLPAGARARRRRGQPDRRASSCRPCGAGATGSPRRRKRRRCSRRCPSDDRALWATALLRRPAPRRAAALRWEDVDLEAGVIRVERVLGPAARASSSRRAGPAAARSRSPPLSATHLAAHKLRRGRATGSSSAATRAARSRRDALVARAAKAWKAAGLDADRPPRGRHTFAR